MKPPYIHPNTPPRLAAKFKKCGYIMRQLSDELGVNMFYIHQLITKGTEPTDKTASGRRTRRALYLPTRKRTRRQAQPLPDHIKWWRNQDRQTIIKQLYELNKE